MFLFIFFFRKCNIVNIIFFFVFYWPTSTVFWINICFSSSSVNTKKKFWGVPYLHMCVILFVSKPLCMCGKCFLCIRCVYLVQTAYFYFMLLRFIIFQFFVQCAALFKFAMSVLTPFLFGKILISNELYQLYWNIMYLQIVKNVDP